MVFWQLNSSVKHFQGFILKQKCLGARRHHGTYYLPCNREFNLDLEINGHNYTISSEHLLLDTPTRDDCELGFYGSDDGEFILGDPLHRAYCLTYDIKNERIGWAKPRQKVPNVVESQAEFI